MTMCDAWKVINNLEKRVSDYYYAIKNKQNIDETELLLQFKDDSKNVICLYKLSSNSTDKMVFFIKYIEALNLYTDLLLKKYQGNNFQISDTMLDEIIEAIDIIEDTIDIIFSCSKKLFSNEEKNVVYEQIGNILYNYAMYLSMIDDFEKAIDILEKNINIYNSVRSIVQMIYLYSTNSRLQDIDKSISLLDKFSYVLLENNQWGYQKFFNISKAYYFVYQSLFDDGNYTRCIEIVNKFDSNFSNIANYDILFKTKKLRIECESKLDEIENPILNLDIIQQIGFKKEILDILDKDVKVYIQTSLSLFNLLHKNYEMSFDFSSVNIPLSKAIELLLFRLINDNFLGYLKQNKANYNLRKGEINKNLFNNHDYSKEIVDGLETNFDIGTALFSIVIANPSEKNTSASNLIRKSFKDFCVANKCIYNGELFDDLIERLFQIKEHRNKCAHRNRVVLADAEECRRILFEDLNVIKVLYECFGELLNK